MKAKCQKKNIRHCFISKRYKKVIYCTRMDIESHTYGDFVRYMIIVNFEKIKRKR
jgi:hypothetical protein